MKIIKRYLVRLLVNLRIRRVSNVFDKFIETWYLDDNFSLDKEVINTHKKKWESIFIRKIDPKELMCYSSNTGIISPDYVPLCVYQNIIEPILNTDEFSKAYGDKNFYDLLYPEGTFPDTIIRNIDGFFFNKVYEPVFLNDDNDLFKILKISNSIIIKPSVASGGGKKVQKFFLKDGCFINSEGNPLTIKMLGINYKQNYLIQKVLNQHAFFTQFNKTSLNTLKVFTYCSPETNQPKVLHAVLRIGAEGKILDNLGSGGYAIGVNASGKLNNYALDNNGKRFEKVNGIMLPGNDFTIPFVDGIIHTAIAIAKRNIHHRILSIDMAVDDLNKIRCMEINTMSNGIDIFQLHNGPLFREYTNEVIDYCMKNKDKLFSYYVF